MFLILFSRHCNVKFCLTCTIWIIPVKCFYDMFWKKRIFEMSNTVPKVLVNILLICSLLHSQIMISGRPFVYSNCCWKLQTLLSGHDCSVSLLVLISVSFVIQIHFILFVKHLLQYLLLLSHLYTSPPSPYLFLAKHSQKWTFLEALGNSDCWSAAEQSSRQCISGKKIPPANVIWHLIFFPIYRTEWLTF